MSRACSVAEDVNCSSAPNSTVRGRVYDCWGCGNPVCLACSNLVFQAIKKGKNKGRSAKVRLCLNCRRERGHNVDS